MSFEESCIPVWHRNADTRRSTCGLMLILFPAFCTLSTPHGISTA